MHPRLAVAGAVLLGAALRFYPVWFGLPYAHARPDETTAVGHAAGILAGDPNPHFFNWPSLTFYLFAGLFEIASWIKGTLTTADQFVIARTAVALAGTLTIVIVARLAGRIGGDRAAAVAALFLAVAVLHARDSHFVTVDVLMTMFAMGCLLLVIDAGDAPSPRALMLAGFAGGLAVSTKYTAAPLALTVLFLAPLWRHGWRLACRDILVFGAAFAAGFVLLSPYAVLDFPTFQIDFNYERQHLMAGHGPDLGRGWSYHPARSLPFGLGLGLYAAAIAGIVPFATKYRRAALPIGGFAIAVLAALAPGKTVFFRYVMTLIPIACISGAFAVDAVAEWLASRVGLRQGVLASVLAAGLAAPSLLTTIGIDRLLARQDTRVLAAEWLRPQLRPEHTLCDVGDMIGLDLTGVEFHAWRFDKPTATFVNAGDRLPEWLVVYDSPIPWYASFDPRLQALTRERYQLAYEVRRVGGVPGSVFDQQDAFFLPISGFSGIERPGPDVLIFRRR